MKIAKANIDNLASVNDDAVKHAIEQLQDFGAKSVEMTFVREGQSKLDSLPLGRIWRLASAVLSARSNDSTNVSKLALNARLDDGENTVIDFITDRLTYEEGLTKAPNRTIPYSLRKGAILRAFEHHSAYLHSVHMNT